MTAGLRERNRGRDRVVERRRSTGPNPRQPRRNPLAVRRPALDQLWLVVESVQEHLVVSIEQLK